MPLVFFALTPQVTETPVVVELKKTYYFCIHSQESFKTIGTVFERDMPAFQAYIKAHNIRPNGPPFFRYYQVDMKNDVMDVEVGWPTAAKPPADKNILSKELPGGRYVSVTHFGPYSDLGGAYMSLQAWADKRGYNKAMVKSDKGPVIDCQLEIYKSDPSKEKDPHKWETEILYKISK